MSSLPLYRGTPAPGYAPTAIVEYGDIAKAPIDNYVWRSMAADLVARNILSNSAAASQKPSWWDESRYGSWAALVERNRGRTEMYAGDYAVLFQAITDMGAPPPDSYLAKELPAYVAPTGKEFRLTREEELRLLADERSDRLIKLREDELEFEKQDAAERREIERKRMELDFQLGMARIGVEQSRIAAEMAMNAARIENDWKIAQLEANTRLTIQERELAFEREKLGVQVSLEQARLALQREQLEWQKQQAQQELALQRARIISELTARPQDLVAREYFLRTGQEPVGNIVNVFSGEVMGQGTLTDAQTGNAGLIGSGAPVGTPPPLIIPGAAGGGYTTEPIFLVGDSESGAPTGYEEIVLNPSRAPLTIVPVRKLLSGRLA